MRFIILILLGLAANPAFSQDSLKNKHYKVRFSVQGKYEAFLFQYQNSNDQVEQYKTYRDGFYSYYEGTIRSNHSFNPELKIDFELPLWLKITGGFSYTKMVYAFGSDRITYNSDNIYAPGSTPANPIVIGSTVTQKVVGYNKDKCELNRASAFLGLGIAKQYRHFHFDLDYSFAINKVTYAHLVRNIYDLDNNYQRTESALLMEPYVQQRDQVLFMHQFSTSMSYRLYKHLHIKAGFQYSKADGPVEDKTYQHYSTFKRMRSYAVIAGIVFSRL